MGWGTGWGGGYGGSGTTAFGLDSDGVPFSIPPGLLDSKTTAVEMLWKQFEGQPTWIDLMVAIGCAFDDVNAQQFDIANFRSLETAFGITLDDVGGIVGFDRSAGALTDDGEYRKALRVEAATLTASGTRPQILELARNLFPLAPRPIQLIDFYPGSWDLRIKNLSAGDIDLFQIIFEDVPNSGVRGFISTYVEGEAGGWSSFYGATDATLTGKWSSFYGATPDALSHWIHGRAIGD